MLQFVVVCMNMYMYALVSGIRRSILVWPGQVNSNDFQVLV